jgi:hypothetical protein
VECGEGVGRVLVGWPEDVEPAGVSAAGEHAESAPGDVGGDSAPVGELGEPAGAGAKRSGRIDDPVLDPVCLDPAGEVAPGSAADPIGWPQQRGGPSDGGDEVSGWISFELIKGGGLASAELDEGEASLGELLEVLAAEPLDRCPHLVGFVEDAGAAADQVAELGRGKDSNPRQLVVEVG